MLVTPIYHGQGLGNQLACIITTKCIALDNGYEFGVAFPDRFKGFFFKNLKLPEFVGVDVLSEGATPFSLPEGYTYYRESMDNNGDYDDKIFNSPDNCVIHGNLQGEKYFEKHKEEIKEWLSVEPMEMSENLCVINFRGGEYVGVDDFFLPKMYWRQAVDNMLRINPSLKFEVHTDDPTTAQRFFPHYPIVSGIEINWRAIRYAKYLILSNSSFAILPAWLNDDAKLIIAPKHFARHNLNYWFLEQNKINKFTYQDKNGNLDNK